MLGKNLKGKCDPVAAFGQSSQHNARPISGDLRLTITGPSDSLIHCQGKKTSFRLLPKIPDKLLEVEGKRFNTKATTNKTATIQRVEAMPVEVSQFLP